MHEPLETSKCVKCCNFIAEPKELITRLRKETSVSPTTKFLVFAIFIGVVITLLLNLMDIPLGWGYSRAVFVILIAVALYALLTKISDKLRRRNISP